MVSHSAGEPELVGGHAAIDLVNTVSWRLDEDRWRDNLVDLTALLGWCKRAELIDAATAAGLAEAGSRDEALSQQVVDDVRDLREKLSSALAMLIGSGNAAVFVVPRDLQTYVVDALQRSDLTGSPALWALAARQLSDVPHLLAISALDLLQSPDLHRLRRCDGPGCGWLFLDRTRSNTRRWCSSSDCGNRERARRHYARHH